MNCDPLTIQQQVVSIVTLVCLFTSGKEFGGYLLLPGAGLLRPLVFTAVCALLTSLTHIVLHTTSILSLIPLDLLKLDMAVYSCLSALFLLSSLLILPVLAAVPPPLQWTRSQLWLTLAVSVLSALLHGVRVYTAYSAWRGCPARRLLSYQFRRRDNGEDAARLDPSST